VKAAIRVGPVEAESGQVSRGLIPIGELADGCTPMQIPVILVNGGDDGPVVYLHGGSHGQETVYAIELMRRLVREELNARRLRGAIILVPAANLLAHQAGSRISPLYGIREGGAFGGDLHKLWPGDASGSMTQLLAATIWTQIVTQSNYVVDYHTNSSPGIPFVLMYQPSGTTNDGAEASAWRRALDLAAAFGLTVVRGAPTPNTLAGASLLAGKAALTIEIPSPRMLSESLIACALRGTKNFLARLAMLDGEIETQIEYPPLTGQHDILPSIRARRGGMVRFEVQPGQFVMAGTVIARIFNVFGDEVEAVPMAHDGYVSTFPPLSWAGAQAIATGDYVADCFS